MIRYILPVAAASLLAASAAWAQPPASPVSGLTQLASPDLIQVQRRDRDDDFRARDRDRKYTAGRRYDRSPDGWRRHGYRRPGDWRTRGCILVGPLWFCP